MVPEQWPLVGREEIVQSIISALDSRSVTLIGEVGVGKSRLAREVAALCEARGWHSEEAIATSATQEIPFGALAHLVPTLPAIDLLLMLQHTSRAVLARAGEAPLLLVVDDAHNLDAASASLIQHLVASGRGRVLGTFRSGGDQTWTESQWKDFEGDVIEVAPLRREETQRLTRAMLGAEVAPALDERLWEVTQGNPLFLREVIRAAEDARAIVVAEGRAVLAGAVEPSPRLAEIVEARLAGATDDHRASLEAIALAEPVPVELLHRMVGVELLAQLERQRLIEVGVLGEERMVRLAHPLYGDVLRARLLPAQRTALVRRLVDALPDPASLSPGAALTAVGWLLSADQEPGPALARRAAAEALAKGDTGLALRMAETASSQAETVEALTILGTALSFRGESADALGHLSRAVELAFSEDERVDAALAMARHLMWRERRSTEAKNLLESVLARAEAPPLKSRLRLELASYAALIGDMETADSWARLVIDDPDADETTVLHGTVWSTLARTMLGSFEGLEEDIGHGTRLATRRMNEMPLAIDQLGINLAMCQRFTDLRKAERTAAMGRTAALRRRGAVGAWDLAHTWILLALGRLDAAEHAIERGERELTEFDPFNNRAMMVSLRAWSSILRGEVESARAMLTSLGDPDQLEPRTRSFYDQARTRLLAHMSGPEEAATYALASSVRAADGGLRVWAAERAFDAVRLGVPGGAVDLVEQLNSQVTVPMVELYLGAARAMASASWGELSDVALALDSRGERLASLDLSATIARHTAGHLSTRAAARAFLLAQDCENARSPLLDDLQDPLTSREQQIAVLAASGLSSREIAGHLYLSTRTVNNHLARLYRKLGVSGRADLPTIVPTMTSEPQP